MLPFREGTAIKLMFYVNMIGTIAYHFGSRSLWRE
jgi:hypothetical protein